MAAATPDGIVLNSYKRWDPSFQESVLRPGVDKSERSVVVIVVVDDAGIGIFARYRPPTRLLLIWSDVQRVTTVNSQLECAESQGLVCP